MKFRKQILKYLVEILIIIIGVVIAFYSTEYGEKLKRNQYEKEVLQQIYFELKDNLLDLEQDFLIHKMGLESNLQVLKFLDQQAVLTDSLVLDFYWMTRDEYIFANSSGYENLKSFGIGLVKDESLKNLITLIYNHDFPRLSKGNTLHPDINQFLTPFFKDHFRINRDPRLQYTLIFSDSFQVTYPREIGLGVQQFIGYVPLDVVALHQNEEFRFLANKSLEFRMYKFRYYRNCIKSVKQAIEKIETEL